MARKRNAGRETKAKIGIARKIPMKTDFKSLENEALKRVDHTLLVMTAFLARWGSLRDKPSGVIPQIARIRKFQSELSSWRKETVRMFGMDDNDARIRRMQQFVDICRSYSS